MSDEVRAVFDPLPDECQFRYLEMWEKSEDHHRAHRDALPAFLAGWDAGQNDLLRRFNVRAQTLLSDFVASLFDDAAATPRRRRRRKVG
jgi:hypothetical protein